MKILTESIFKKLNESTSGNTIKDYAMNYLNGYIDNDVTDTEIDMSVAFSFDFNEEPDADFKAYNDFMNLIAERTKVVKVNDSEYGATLVCDFSSVFKPYNEQLKEFFDMENSEFDEDEAWAEAVANLEALISGNAGDSTYNELINILNGKQVTNEADNLESTIDEAARYLFDEGDADYLPDYEEFNDSTMEISKDLFDKAKEKALKALTAKVEHEYYDHENREYMLQLNDNHTIWELNGEKFDDEGYTRLCQEAAKTFQEETGTELYFCGRSARHVCVEPTYDNCMNFDYLQEVQERLERGVIDAYNQDNMNESAVQTKEQVDPNNLTKEQLWKLRQEIVLGSLYTHDYDNSFGIDPSAVCNFFDSFIEDAQTDDYGNSNNRKVEDYDNAEELYNYYLSCENPFGELPKTDMNESEDISNELYVYSNAESENKSDAQSMIWSTYKPEAPKLNFQIHSEGPMYFVDFIGSKEDIAEYLKELGWYTDEEIEEYNLIKPYKEV